MSDMKNRWMKRLGIGTLALLGVGAVTLPSSPADARVFFDVGGPAYGYAPYYARTPTQLMAMRRIITATRMVGLRSGTAAAIAGANQPTALDKRAPGPAAGGLPFYHAHDLSSVQTRSSDTVSGMK